MSGVQVGFIQMSLAEMSLAAGILILGIVLFRFLFIHRIPKRIMVILWGIAVLRLLIPFCLSLPIPGIGIFMPEHMQPAEYIFEEVTISSVNLGEESADTALYMAGMPAKLNWEMMLKILYLAGTAVMTAGSVYLYKKDGRLFRESLPMDQEEKERLIKLTGAGQKEQNRLKKIDFRISDRTATPVAYGIFRPAVVFPRGIFWEKEKEAGFCLLHELVHIKNRDNLQKVIVHTALCIHWFNPLVWVMYSLFNRDIELLCDEEAVRKCKAQRQEYALALLSLAEHRSAGFRTALGFGKNAVKERILAVMTAGKTTIGGGVAAFLALTLALTVFLGSQASAAGLRHGEYTVTFVEAEPHITVNFTGEALAESMEGTAVDVVMEDYETTAAEFMTEDDKMTVAEFVAEDDKMTATDFVTEDGEMTAIEAVAEDVYLPDTLMLSLQNLAEEYEIYGLEIEITPDDYQLYFEGKPVYFLVDNRSLEENKFSGSVYAREAGGENGNTGVAVKRDESGIVVGLVSLSEEESKDTARAWTGRRF
ncbi:MAG: M56 family metallopeptidase [Lachnospiraceae bacterium]|nr:M56 family metallopeptidase [Lachnospiraceae bacterium]